MKFATLFATTLLLVSDPAEARRTTTIKGRNSKSVRGYYCDPLCLFKNDNNSWCFLADPPMLRAGWTWTQTFGDVSFANAVKYWQIEFIPFIQVQVYLESIFDI